KFSKNEIPDNIPEKILKTKEVIPLANILKDIDMVSSTSEALRLINQGAVKIDQKKIESKDYDFGLDEKKLVQIGKKKFIYLTLKNH
ncbi:MAG: tyrosine--tRNA ligase, partial [Gammaproteobacteria bacterium]|nr:tyrosine--tRNA ligase [Gammaproteobacteria bacterium]